MCVSDQGELLVKGNTIFHEYHGLPDKTAKAFDSNGWFMTGDEVELTTTESGTKAYKINGRQSVDILKVHGYKISALDIEATVLSHDAVAESVVVGVHDDDAGQRIVAVVRLQEGHQLTLKQLRTWCTGQAAHYKAPAELVVVEQVPRNAMGKVNKKRLMDHLVKHCSSIVCHERKA